MAFNVTAVLKASVAEITLSGDLDAAAAPRFQRELEGVAAGKPRQLVLRVRDLVYLASAGVRMLIVARQKMGPGVDVYVIAPQEQVLDTLRRTGLLPSVIIQDEDVAGQVPLP
jgi:anti-anti-sigma factor